MTSLRYVPYVSSVSCVTFLRHVRRLRPLNYVSSVTSLTFLALHVLRALRWMETPLYWFYRTMTHQEFSRPQPPAAGSRLEFKEAAGRGSYSGLGL